MIGPDEKMADLADRGELPYEDDSRFYLEIDRENQLAIICFVEPLYFHEEYLGKGSSQDDWSPLADSDGYLTAYASGKIAERLQRLIKEQGHVAVEVDYGIGAYEYWGATGYDSRTALVSHCCEAETEWRIGA